MSAATTTSSSSSTRPKCRFTAPPPPSPKILHFPRIRRTPRRTTHRINPFLILHRRQPNLKYFCNHQNQHHDLHSSVISPSRDVLIENRIRVEEQGGDSGQYEVANRLAEEKWMFQAEILRAECNFLRMEREFALKKLHRNRVKMERALRSAVQTLVAGRNDIFEGKNATTVLEKEIADLSEKLEELHRSSRATKPVVRNCRNFDKKASLLQHQMGKLGESPNESSWDGLQGVQEVDKQSYVSTNKSSEVDELSKKMEGLSKGMMLENAMEEEEGENGSMVSSTANGCIVDSSVYDSKGVVCPNLSSFSTTQELIVAEDNRCSGHCKAIVHRIVEQVRAETEQWSQMQEMLERVRGEMEELQASHDFWEKRAQNSAHEIQSLNQTVEEWQRKALCYKTQANELEAQVSELQEKLSKAKSEFKPAKNSNIQSKENNDVDEHKGSPVITLGKRLAKERKMLLLRLKERPEEISSDGRRRKAYASSSGVSADLQRAPFQDIENLSRQD